MADKQQKVSVVKAGDVTQRVGVEVIHRKQKGLRAPYSWSTE